MLKIWNVASAVSRTKVKEVYLPVLAYTVGIAVVPRVKVILFDAFQNTLDLIDTFDRESESEKAAAQVTIGTFTGGGNGLVCIFCRGHNSIQLMSRSLRHQVICFFA